MSDVVDQLRQRFAVVTATNDVSPKPKRRDFKGPRGRLGLRLSQQLIDDLQLLVTATGADKNSLCEDVLGAAVADRLAAVRSRYTDAEWEGVKRCARGNTQTP